MHLKPNTRRSLIWGLVLVAGVVGTATYAQPPMPMQPPTTGTVKVDKTGALIVPLGGLVSFDTKLPEPPTDILVAREDILQVRIDPNDPKKLLMTGKTTGVTQLTLVQKDKPKIVYDVVVQPDLDLLRNLIRRTVPTAAIDVQPGIGNVIVLSGYVTSPQDAETVSRLAASAVGGNANNVINAVQVGGGQQVQIDVVVASVDRNLLRSRGFDFSVRGSTANFTSIVSGLITGGVLTGAPTVGGDGQFIFSIVPTQFFGVLRALRTEGIARFLAEPRVVTQSGRPAFFRAGGQQAIISGTSGITGPGVQLVPFGTELEVLPIVYGNGNIWLEINPRVSAVSQGLGINIGGTISPGFTEQQIRAAVMLESGQTYAIGGLIQNSVQASSTKIPVLGEVPYLGTLFSRVTHEQRESELVILVTPRLVGPMNCDQVPKRVPGRETRSPDDYELFLENVLEAPRGQRKVWEGKCYNAPYRCDPAAAIFPCVGGVCNPAMGGGLGGCSTGTCNTGMGGIGATPMLTPHNSLPANTLPAIGSAPATSVPAVLPSGTSSGVALPAIPSAVPGAPVSTEGITAPAPISPLSSIPPAVVVPSVPRN